MKKLTLGLIGIVLLLIVIVGFAYGKGITGNVIREETVMEEIIIPVKVHIVEDSSGYYTSSRDEENIRELFDEVNRIWRHGNIKFVIDEVLVTSVSFETIPGAINDNYQGLIKNDNYFVGKLNAFFVQSLNGINGLAFLGIDSILVSDITTVNDFRTTAHEFGHILGLRHVLENSNLMARGKNGETLSDWEIEIARNNAERYRE